MATPYQFYQTMVSPQKIPARIDNKTPPLNTKQRGRSIWIRMGVSGRGTELTVFHIDPSVLAIRSVEAVQIRHFEIYS